MTDFARRVGSPPSSLTGVLRQYLQDLADAVNDLPRFSTFSYASPEGNVMAQAPAVGVNESSSGSRVWAKVTGSDTTGWQAIA